MLSIRHILRQWHPSSSTISTTNVLLRFYHQPSAATVRYPPNLTDNFAPLRCLTPLDANRLPSTSQHNLLLLATPLLAPLLFDNKQWLIAILNKLYAAVPKHEFRIRVGVAVVDSLPAPKKICNDDCLSSNDLLHNSSFDGLAYLLGESNLFTSFSLAGLPTEKPATISLELQPFNRHRNHTYEVHIPLANTTFAVGHETVSMVVDFKKSSEKPFREISSVNTRNITVSWPWPIQDDSRFDGSLALSTPLLPLTIPRKILTSMGNIVRQISGSKTNATTIPASSELETAVTSFFKTTNLPQSPISVWALVTPAKIYESQKANTPLLFRGSPQRLQKLWKSSNFIPDSDFLPPFKQGAHLHRVLSGGGGWGQKAGLLALDPVTNFAIDESDQQLYSSKDPDPTSFRKAMLGDVAPVGHYIQFFISRVEGAKVEPDFGNLPSRLWSLHVGTIPSTIDQIPRESKPSEETESNYGTYFPNHFGVLSEKGFSIKISPDETRIHPTIPFNCSKVDVPFSLLTTQQLPSTLTTRPNHRPNTTRSYKEQQFQNLPFLIERIEQKLIFYVRIVADTLQFQSSKARSKFNQFFELVEIWHNEKPYRPTTPYSRDKSYEDLWAMTNSAMQLEIEARVLSRLEKQILVSECWISQLKAWLNENLYVEERPNHKSVISTVPFSPSTGRNWRKLNLGTTVEDSLADKAWHLINKDLVRRVRREMYPGNRNPQNQIVAEQVAKLLDGFQP